MNYTCDVEGGGGVLSCESTALFDVSSGSGDEGGVSMVTASSGLQQKYSVCLKQYKCNITRNLELFFILSFSVNNRMILSTGVNLIENFWIIFMWVFKVIETLKISYQKLSFFEINPL